MKPGNLLRSEEGQVKLADFGIAKATDGSAITQAGSVLGTAAYLAPEQAHGEVAAARRTSTASASSRTSCWPGVSPTRRRR